MTVYVIIVTYNGMRWINKCLKSISHSRIQLITLIIDNNSTDTTVSFIKTHYPEIQIIENKENFGFGKANNFGLQYAVNYNADYVLLLNQDAYLKPNTVEKLINSHKRYPSYGIISPVHLNTSETLDKHFAECISQQNPDKIKELANINPAYIESTNFVNAACWLMSVDCIKKVGGFDPLFKHYGEDRDYCNRTKYHGFEIGVSYQSYIYHDRIYSSDNKFRKLSNILFSIGLAKLKDINRSFISNLLNLNLERTKKIIKAIIHFDIKRVTVEVLILFKLALLIPKILQRRKYCKETYLQFK